MSEIIWYLSFSDWLISVSMVTAKGAGRLRDEGIEQKGKSTHGHGQHCGDYSGKGEYRGLNGNGKYKKIKLKNNNQH